MRSSRTPFRIVLGPLLAVAVVSLWVPPATADDEGHLSGVITERVDASTVYVQTETGQVLMTMNEVTSVRQSNGIWRHKSVGADELIPGLRVRAEGQYETADKFIARKVAFSKDARKIAGDIQAGVATTERRSLANRAAIEQQEQRLAQQQKEIAANEQHIAATSGRISNLDNFTNVKTLTVYFANGRYNVSAAQKAELQQLAAQAQGIQGYMISVSGYASAVGSGALNQRLSMQRADAVTAILNQAGVPPANVMVPAAMGVSQQVAPNTTAKGQAENRRAVVTLMQNKGIAGR
jgi:OmpA-OmpF porin, OOP family